MPYTKAFTTVFKIYLTQALFLVVAAVVISSCSSSTTSTTTTTTSTSSTPVELWTWISGSDVVDQSGTYGTQDTADSANVPGARQFSITWTDSSDNLWLFGGYGYDSAGTSGYLNDLWKFDGSDWTWVSGSNVVTQYGTYGTQGTASSSNVPGARFKSISWIDSSGNLWLFGGHGYNAVQLGRLNDLWKFDGSDWTWVSGSSGVNQGGTYGTQGTANASNVPGGRSNSISWTDGSGNLWLFGGFGYDSASAAGLLNDLWKYDGSDWTWVSGSNVRLESGTYGTQGTADSANVPGARYRSTSWTDSSDNLWLLGGYGYDSAGTLGYLNDLWKFDGSNWTWVSGSNVVTQSGTYGTQGTADSTNVPGARQFSISWTDSSDNLWLFSGSGYDSEGTLDRLNDLWKFDGSDWTWVSGSNVVTQSGTYGTQGTADDANVPGARSGPISWIDASDNLWLLGGYGYDSADTSGYLNDLWRYEP